MSIVYPCLVLGAVICGVLAICATRLLAASLWLAGLSALLSVLFYLMSAPRVAAIELSVGAGLVTVLFVFAIGIAGEATVNQKALVPQPLAWGLGLLVFLLLSWFILPLIGAQAPVSEPSLATLLWEGRTLDVWVQVVLIFAGVLGILGLLTEAPVSQITRLGDAAQVQQVDPKPDPKTGYREVRS
jgi:uncharacterized MnhB-related membrane protein